MVRVILPTHLRRLANVNREVELSVEGSLTLEGVLDALETRYPMLRGTIRDQVTKERRAFIRFFVVGEDWSHKPQDVLLPDVIKTGAEPLWVVGAMAGG